MLFTTPNGFPRSDLARAAAWLAERNVFIGTSSWKYPGWVGQLYEEQRYLHRGRFSESRFERDCLAEYAEVFRTVCVDGGYYRFPSPDSIAGLASAAGPGFKLCFKVTDEITARTFPNLPRHGAKAGQRNEHFLNADLFQAAFLASCERHRDSIGVLIFEFSHFHPRDFERGRDFVAALDAFLAQLPSGWQYGVEVRNSSLLCAPYFDMLRAHGVAHVLNNWTAMPSVLEQMAMPGALTSDEFTAARFLLKPGRSYEQAVASFSPYDRTQEINADARRAAAELARMRSQAANAGAKTKPTFLLVNNRLEGNALHTLLHIAQQTAAGIFPPAA